jgi:uncharacterized damage-inducible protein DinB
MHANPLTNPLTEHFRRLHEYEVWANARALASLESVPPDRRALPAYVRATQLLPHNTLARKVWIWRVQGTPYDNPRDWFPAWTPEETRAALKEADDLWAAFLASLTDAHLSRDFQYSSSEGVRYASTLHEVLTHVLNHGTYHRGQLARLVHESGGQRAATDFIAFSRLTIEPHALRT